MGGGVRSIFAGGHVASRMLRRVAPLVKSKGNVNGIVHAVEDDPVVHLRDNALAGRNRVHVGKGTISVSPRFFVAQNVNSAHFPILEQERPHILTVHGGGYLTNEQTGRFRLLRNTVFGGNWRFGHHFGRTVRVGGIVTSSEEREGTQNQSNFSDNGRKTTRAPA